jgi:hypothetical protein
MDSIYIVQRVEGTIPCSNPKTEDWALGKFQGRVKHCNKQTLTDRLILGGFQGFIRLSFTVTNVETDLNDILSGFLPLRSRQLKWPRLYVCLTQEITR